MAIYRNIKTRGLYKAISSLVINATNGAEDDERMTLYKDKDGRRFVRKNSEFILKFDKTNLKSMIEE
jgi:hypothetical protein